MAALTSDGVSAALIAAAAALTLWLLKEVLASGRGLRDARLRRREAVLRFYVDVLLRIENCGAMQSPEARSHFRSTLMRYADEGRPFVAYGVHTDDREAYDLVEAHLHTLDDNAVVAIRRFIVTDDLFVEQYQKMSTADFSALSVDRQLSVAEDLFESAGDVVRAGHDAHFAIECMPGFAALSRIRRASEVGRSTLQQGTNRTLHGGTSEFKPNEFKPTSKI